MHFISHRGNLDGPKHECENKPEYILYALNNGFDVEIDVWYLDNNLYLGHDEPQYIIDADFFMKHSERLWCHAKHAPSLRELLRIGNLHIFSHDKDPVVLTSKCVAWAYPGQPLDDNTICVMPERVESIYTIDELKKCKGICSDFIQKYRDTLS